MYFGSKASAHILGWRTMHHTFALNVKNKQYTNNWIRSTGFLSTHTNAYQLCALHGATAKKNNILIIFFYGIKSIAVGTDIQTSAHTHRQLWFYESSDEAINDYDAFSKIIHWCGNFPVFAFFFFNRVNIHLDFFSSEMEEWSYDSQPLERERLEISSFSRSINRSNKKWSIAQFSFNYLCNIFVNQMEVEGN